MRRNQSEYDVHASVDSFSTAIMSALENYSAEVAVVAKEAVQKAAEQCRQEISAASPKSDLHDKYAKSWKAKQVYYSHDECRVMVYNEKHYQLTHLLEYGHEKWIYGTYTGGRVKAFPHIRPAEQRAEQNLIATIKRKLS